MSRCVKLKEIRRKPVYRRAMCTLRGAMPRSVASARSAERTAVTKGLNILTPGN